jgi:hypothetical protein
LLGLAIESVRFVAGFVIDDQGALEAVLNAVVADEQVLDSPEGVPMR